MQDDDALEAAVAHEARVARAGPGVVGGDVAAQRGAPRGLAEHRQQLVDRQAVQRLRQGARQARRELGVRVVVERDVETLGARPVDDGEVLGGRRSAPLGGVVRHLHRQAALAAYAHGLFDRRHDRLALAAHVAWRRDRRSA